MRTSIKNIWDKLYTELNDTDSYTPTESLEAIEEIIGDLESMQDALQSDIDAAAEEETTGEDE